MIITVSCITAKTKYHGPKQHIAVDAALKKFFSGIDFSETYCPIEFVSLLGAESRVLANDLSSAIDIPPFVTAQMDGYAIKSADTKNASTKNPVILKVVGKIYDKYDLHCISKIKDRKRDTGTVRPLKMDIKYMFVMLLIY